jgi:3-keto-disaccharide hydrolase
MRTTGTLMGLILAVAALTMTTGAQAPTDNTLTAAEQKAGWRLLFDGKTIDQWRNYKGTEIGTNWTIVDGAITLTTPRRAVDIISKDEFTDFDFTFDWQLAPAPPAGNSGVMFYVIEQGDATYYSGPEYQLLDNATHPDGKNPLTSAGSCYALYAPARDASRPIGEWNTSRILINKGKVEHWLNGEKIVTYDMNSQDWKDKVAGSKFKEWPEFGLARKGHLALQQHGAKVAFKNLKIREIK